MTDRDKIKEWMREAGAGRGAIVPETYDGVVDIFARVVERAVAAEREACAKVAADRYKLAPLVDQETCDECAAAIRARGKA
jgi:hypothetical protein